MKNNKLNKNSVNNTKQNKKKGKLPLICLFGFGGAALAGGISLIATGIVLNNKDPMVDKAILEFKAKDTDTNVKFEGSTKCLITPEGQKDPTQFKDCIKPIASLEGKEFFNWQYLGEDGQYHDFLGEETFDKGTHTIYANFSGVKLEDKIWIELPETNLKVWLKNPTDTTGNLIFIDEDGNEHTFAREDFEGEIHIGDNITEININFMANCKNFTNNGKPLAIPSTITKIGDSFLYGCEKYNQQIDLSACNDLTTIGNSFMSKCNSFNSSIIFPTFEDKELKIGNCFLFECTNFNNSEEDFTIPSSVIRIPGSFMEGCTKFNKNIIFHEKIESIGSYFMARCSAFNFGYDTVASPTDLPAGVSITLPESIQAIGSNFMSDCVGFCLPLDLSKCTNITSIEDNFLKGCTNDFCCVTLPNSVAAIGNNFMHSCSYFVSCLKTADGKLGQKQFALPSSIKTIGDNFMYGCGSYAIQSQTKPSIELPSSITTIGTGFLFNAVTLTKKHATAKIVVPFIKINCPVSVFKTSDTSFALGTTETFADEGHFNIKVTSEDEKTAFEEKFPETEESQMEPPYRKIEVTVIS